MGLDKAAPYIFKNVFFIFAVVLFILQIILRFVLNPLAWSRFTLVVGPLVLVLLVIAVIVGVKKSKAQETPPTIGGEV